MAPLVTRQPTRPPIGGGLALRAHRRFTAIPRLDNCPDTPNARTFINGRVRVLYALFTLFSAKILYKCIAGFKERRYPHPPGPKPLPIVGNLWDIPSMPTWVAYREWRDRYGSDILRLNVLGFNLIILNSSKAVAELMEKRSAITSDRMRLVMVNELCGFGWNTSAIRYGPEWRAQRRAFHSHFSAQASKKYRRVEEETARRYLNNLLERPEGFLGHTRHMAGAEIMQLAYGIKVQDRDDPYLEIAEKALQSGAAGGKAGAFLVDIFPIMKYIPAWMPGAGFQRQARIWKSSVMALKDVPFAKYRQQLEQEGSIDCIATSLLADAQQSVETGEHALTEEVIKAVLGTMYGGASDTRVSTINSFILAMVLYPEVQTKAQAEIDRVCPGRLPNFGDYDSLPYVQAIVKEALRWHPVLPEGIPHATSEDDVYEGYFIPKGSIIIANVWAILHDEETYPDPLRFHPDRFLAGDGTLDPSAPDPSAAFGFGRRVCPGKAMAQDSIWVAVASVLAVFTISKARDASGKPITPPEEYDKTSIRHPKPFPCDIQPRSAEHAAMIRAAVGELEYE